MHHDHPRPPPVPELAKMVEEGRLRLFKADEWLDGYAIDLPQYVSLWVLNHDHAVITDTKVDGGMVPNVSTQPQAAEWIAKRINQAPAKAGGERT